MGNIKFILFKKWSLAFYWVLSLNYDLHSFCAHSLWQFSEKRMTKCYANLFLTCMRMRVCMYFYRKKCLFFFFLFKANYFFYMGLPMPRPGIWGASPPPLFGLLIVSSTERIRQAASQAAVRALILTTAGSQTQLSKLSAMSSLLMSTPYQHLPEWCFWRSLFRMLVASNPALSHSCLECRQI